VTEFEFRKSSYSGGEQQHECVEVATNLAGIVAVRDSKQPARGHIQCPPAQWAAFTQTLVRGELSS
jgi:hypothetical protein